MERKQEQNVLYRLLVYNVTHVCTCTHVNVRLNIKLKECGMLVTYLSPVLENETECIEFLSAGFMESKSKNLMHV